MKEVFTRIYRENRWGGKESVSGPGSSKNAARKIIARLPALLEQYQISSVLDIPCGDYNWMSEVKLGGVQYIGADIVEELIKRNSCFERENVVFRCLDITSDPLPRCDLVLTRDCLVHLSNEQVIQALKRILDSGARFFLTTVFTARSVNSDCRTGRWRPLNLQAAPFLFPDPLEILNEGRRQSYSDKALALWRLERLRPIIDSF